MTGSTAMGGSSLLPFRFTVIATLIVVSLSGAEAGIGINYGTLGDNLPSPTQVASFLKAASETPISISKVKLFNPDAAILSAFANTGIDIVIGMSTAELIEIGVHGSASLAMQWVKDNVVPYVPATKIVAIAAGNEVVGTHDKALIGHMVPAMQNLHEALSSLNLTAPIQVSSPFSLGILHSSVPPSSATFKKPSLMAPFLSFLATTGSPFMANVYPFFAYTADPSPFTLDYALFNSSVGYTDPLTNLHYTGMFDAQLDAVYAAMAHMNFTNISIMVSETGWPSAGDPSQVGVNALNAQTYVNNLIKHVLSDKGTPLRPHQPLDAYIFSLFNEDLKPGPTSERHYGLFRTDFSPVYSTILSDSALLIDTSPSHNASLASKLAPTPAPPLEPGSPSPPSFSSRLVPAYFLTLPFLVCTNLLLV